MIRRLIGMLAVLAILSAGLAHATHEVELRPDPAPVTHQHSGHQPTTGLDVAPVAAHHMNSSVCGLCAPTFASAQMPPRPSPTNWETTPASELVNRATPPPHRPPKSPA
ncbi:DUF2946 family protein [Inquilinus sp. CAU 1745]|uniref:DUF2946 family protein n=1 Tax=Inquilinus sp. CAU 1745 TaxID=3140369 RepID=UPI00325B663E